jgi:hypothetical protein
MIIFESLMITIEANNILKAADSSYKTQNIQVPRDNPVPVSTTS